MHNRRFLKMVWLTALFIISITGCGGAEKEPVSIVLQMFSGPKHDAMIPVVDYWNEHHVDETGITVELIEMNRVGYFSKLETQLAAMPFPKLAPWVEAYGRSVSIHKDITDLMMIGSS